MKIIGITGNSGSGKSTVCKILKKNNAYIIDTDKIGHKALEKDTFVYKELVNRYGQKILDIDKNIVRKSLGNIVFNDRNELDFLNKYSHKYIKNEIEEKIDELKNSSDYSMIVIDGALLIEVKIDKLCDELWLIESDFLAKVQRIMLRDSIDEEMAKNRLAKQTDFLKEKEKFDVIIFNNEFDKLENKVRKELYRLR